MGLRIYRINGDSMLPNYKSGDYVLIKSYKANEMPERGDTVVAIDPTRRNLTYFKRVVGLPNEEIAFNDGLLLINGEHFPEPYLRGLPADIGLGSSSWKVGECEAFIMGDNRAHSNDSRTFGPIALEHIQGKVSFRLWPLSAPK